MYQGKNSGICEKTCICLGGINLETVKRSLIASVAALFVSAYAFMLSPFIVISDPGAGVHPLVIVEGVIFYAGLIVGYIFLFTASKQLKKEKAGKAAPGEKPGLITFFSSVPAAVLDTVFILSLIMTVIAFLTGEALPDILIYFCVSTFIFSAQLRAIVNGVVFRTAFGIKQSGTKHGKRGLQK